MAVPICKYCGERFADDAPRNKQFCNAAHKQAYYRRIKRKKEEHSSRMSELMTLPEHVQDMIYLAFGADNKDVVREILREEIRDTMTQGVRDNVLGATEQLTQMLPKVLAGLLKDIESSDWVIRSRAQALILKYAMAMADKQGDRESSAPLTMVHQVIVPDTNLGHRVVEEVEILDAKEEAFPLEAIEKNYPICGSCNERKHPDAMKKNGTTESGKQRWRCKTCEAKAQLKAGNRSIESVTEDRFG